MLGGEVLSPDIRSPSDLAEETASALSPS